MWQCCMYHVRCSKLSVVLSASWQCSCVHYVQCALCKVVCILCNIVFVTCSKRSDVLSASWQQTGILLTASLPTRSRVKRQTMWQYTVCYALCVMCNVQYTLCIAQHLSPPALVSSFKPFGNVVLWYALVYMWCALCGTCIMHYVQCAKHTVHCTASLPTRSCVKRQTEGDHLMCQFNLSFLSQQVSPVPCKVTAKPKQGTNESTVKPFLLVNRRFQDNCLFGF